MPDDQKVKGEKMPVSPPAPLLEKQLERVFFLRNMALKLLQRDGDWQDVEGYPGRVRSYEGERLLIMHRTPFQPVPVSGAAVLAGVSPETQRDIAREYGLDVWLDNKKVLSLIWNNGGSLGIVLFREGPWEDELADVANAKA
jgi:hypothetical protein